MFKAQKGSKDIVKIVFCTQKVLDFKNVLICVLKMDKDLTGLERQVTDDRIFIFIIPLKGSSDAQFHTNWYDLLWS